MSEALLLVAEGYEQIAAGIRKMVAAQKDTPKKVEKPVKKAEKKETPVEDTPKDESAPEEKTVDRKTVRAFLAEKSRAGKTSEVKNLIEQFIRIIIRYRSFGSFLQIFIDEVLCHRMSSTPFCCEGRFFIQELLLQQ